MWSKSTKKIIYWVSGVTECKAQSRTPTLFLARGSHASIFPSLEPQTNSWWNEIKLQHKIIREEKFQQRKLERQQEKLEGPKFMALKPGQKFQGFRSTTEQPKKKLAKYLSVSSVIFLFYALTINTIHNLSQGFTWWANSFRRRCRQS